MKVSQSLIIYVKSSAEILAEVFNDGSVSTKVQINENMNTWHGFDFGDIYYNPNFYNVEITDISGIEQNGVKVYTNDVFDNENYPNANGLDIKAQGLMPADPDDNKMDMLVDQALAQSR